MNRLKMGLALTLGAALISGSAFAGQAQPAIVNVDLAGSFASGDMITAFDDKNDEVFIGCGTRNTDNGVGGIASRAFCQARDADGDQAVCFTFNADLVETVHAINSDSYVQFFWTDDGSGFLTCQHIGLLTQSFYLDKHTMGNTQGK